MGLFGMTSDAVEFTTSDSLAVLGRKLQRIASNLKAKVESLESTSGALASFDDHADIEVVLSGRLPLNTNFWAVQVYVVDQGKQREVQLVAMGQGAFGKLAANYGAAHRGFEGGFSLSGSQKRRDQIAAELRA
jgi:hypothetical protein